MKNQEYLNHLRHSSAHLLAAAVMELWPDTKRTIGPAVENGFYYDFEFSSPISESDLPRVEQKMKEILKSWDKFEGREVSKEEALTMYEGNPYKKELIEEFAGKGETLTVYKSGNYEDLCRGGHIENPKEKLSHFKLLSLAGAYWRGNEKNQMLTRIYGTSFPTKEELDKHLWQIEEAKKRDHKKLGPVLNLFMFHETSPGMPYWLPSGVILYNELIHFWRNEHQKRGYKEIVSPLLNKKELYVMSGHYDHYWENMFVAETAEEEVYGMKAMNCPNAMIVFKSRAHSYRELPLRLSDTDTLHRYERSGTLNGLFRVREFRQDDAHIFVTEDQIQAEYENVFEIVERFYSIFNIKYSFRLGTRPEKFLGDQKVWDKAEKALKEILDKSGKEYFVLGGDGAFYGPKIDILMKDALGRDWQMGTIQLDFQIPKRFELEYAAKDGSRKTPVVIHRVIYGSLERFIGILIEHYAGAFPLWLSPVQVAILPISDKHLEYAREIQKALQRKDIRAELNEEKKTLGAKIRESTLQKVPYLVIIGDKELKDHVISVRTREGKDLGQTGLSEFAKKLSEEIEKYV